MIYIVNESSRVGIYGSIDFYRDIGTLLDNVEIVDVLNREYQVYDSTGNSFDLIVDRKANKIDAVNVGSEFGKEELTSILREFLLWVANDGRFGVNRNEVLRSTKINELMELIPSKFIK